GSEQTPQRRSCRCSGTTRNVYAAKQHSPNSAGSTRFRLPRGRPTDIASIVADTDTSTPRSTASSLSECDSMSVRRLTWRAGSPRERQRPRSSAASSVTSSARSGETPAISGTRHSHSRLDRYRSIHRRVHGELGQRSPAEAEEAYWTTRYDQPAELTRAR